MRHLSPKRKFLKLSTCKCAWALLAGLLLSASVWADSASYVGTLASSESVFEVTLTLPATENVTLQTYGFGGGTNAAGTAISAGGTDPFLAIFAGTGSSATMLTDGSGNPYGTSLDLSNYGSFAGCPPAGTVNFGGAVCGDISMSLASLAAGTYTIVLSDGEYYANAVFDNGTLGEGFTDLTDGVFCNIANGPVNCPNVSGAYALDVITSGSSTSTGTTVPEPGTLLLVGISVGTVVMAKELLLQR